MCKLYLKRPKHLSSNQINNRLHLKQNVLRTTWYWNLLLCNISYIFYMDVLSTNICLYGFGK